MKTSIWTVIFAATLSASSAFAHGYDKTFHITQDWSGEYPNGFSVVKRGVKLPARAAMDRAQAKTISCELPYRAVYHPWNTKRPATYWTASKIVPMIAQEDLVLTDGDLETPVKRGEIIEHLVYGAEGYFLVRYNGKEYGAHQDLLEKVSYDLKLMNTPQEEWVHVRCVGGTKAWVFMPETMHAEDDGEPEYVRGLDSWSRGFREYGQVTDLTDKDLKKKN